MKKIGIVMMILGLIAAFAPLQRVQAKTKYIEKSEVTKAMVEFNKALGVKCNFCHVADRSKTYKALAGQTADPKELSALVHQRISRAMLGNMLYINKTEGKNITCNSCHQGKAEVAVEPK